MVGEAGSFVFTGALWLGCGEVVTERCRKWEFAHSMRRLVEEQCPQAERIRVVLADLSTHTAAAFYESCSAEVAWKLA
jgi:hypothetical protein